MNRYPQGWLVGHVEKIPAAGGDHAIIRQRRVENAITVIITTALAQRNNGGDAIGKYPGRCSLAQRKPSDQRSLHQSLGARRERNLPRHQKIFLQKRSSHNGYPLMRAEPFLGKFLGEGPGLKSQNRKSPLPGAKRAAIGARLGSPIFRCQTGRGRADRPGRLGWQCCPLMVRFDCATKVYKLVTRRQ